MRISDWSSDVCSSDLREILADRHLGEGGEQGVELGAGRAVAVDAAVGLLEHQAGRERQRSVDGEVAREVGGEDQNALGVEGPAQIDLALDVDHLAGTHAHPGSDATRPTEGEAAELHHAETVHLPRSEEHTSELQSLMRNSYAVFCLKKKKKIYQKNTPDIK